MSNRIFVAIVVLLWLVAMSWLIVTKVLPPFGHGLPPSFLGLPDDTQSCWRVYLNEKPIGWAASRVMAGSNGTKEIHARLLIEGVRFANLAPQWKKQIEAAQIDLGPMTLDARSRIELDPLKNLASLAAKGRIDPLAIEFSLHGRVEKSELELHFQTGPFSHSIEKMIPDNARLGADLWPDAKMPGMYVGRHWQMQVINLLPGGSPTQLIEAEVVREEIIDYNGDLASTRRLEYRRTDLIGADSDEAVLSVLWVTEDGTVLRQESIVLGSKLRFDKADDVASQKKAKALIAPLIGERSEVTMKD